jgi:DNA topoisomerase-1
MTTLLVLESPNKTAKVQGFVGSDYVVSASKGHIRTLGKYNELGIDIENDFAPSYLIDDNKQMVVANLRKLLRKCDISNEVIIATDFDREGEAIGWHICQVLGIDIANAPRLVFKEITKRGLTDALANPVRLDMNMIYSQQARMILDKLIGFKVCDVIHKHFKNWKLSAGRVQSVVAKLIIERENEIAGFSKSNYLKAKVGFVINDKESKLKQKSSDLQAVLANELTNVEEAGNIISATDNGSATYFIAGKTTNKSKRKPAPPFITSSLQQEASNRFGMSPKVCMSVAQKLYEAGMITYMRTDSLMLSDKVLQDCKTYITTEYGPEYHKWTVYNKKKAKGAQEAHEACRPVNINRYSVKGVDKCGPQEQKLYKLIWQRTVASQMQPADVETRTIKIAMDATEAEPQLASSNPESPDYIFNSKFEKILFQGFLKVYQKAKTEDDGSSDEDAATSSTKLEKLYDTLKKGDQVWCNNMDIQEQETKAPTARYTEASLVKQLEKLGIGRPSTYASMIDKVQSRDYVQKKNLTGEMKEFYTLSYSYPNNITIDKREKRVGAEKNKLVPTSLGIMINDYLQDNFTRFMDYEFTSSVELQLDEIAEGKLAWNKVVQGIYDYMLPTLTKLLSEIKLLGGGSSANKRLLGSHPTTNLPVYIIKTRKGWFICEEHEDKKKTRWGTITDITAKPESITLEMALPTLKYPFVIGNYKAKTIQVCKANNIYLKYGGKNLSIDNYITQSGKQNDVIPEEITKDQCIDVINFYEEQAKQQAILDKQTYEFEGNTDIQVKNGRYGYYIRYLKMYNVPLPTKYKKDITELNEEVVMKAISSFLKKENKKGGAPVKKTTKKKT